MKHTLKDVIILLEQMIDNKTRLLSEYHLRKTRGVKMFDGVVIDTAVKFLMINIDELNRIHADLMNVYEGTENKMS